MAVHNFLDELQRSILDRTMNITATPDPVLTNDQVMRTFLISASHATVAIAVALPAAGLANKGAIMLILNSGVAAVTVTSAAGFGGAGVTATSSQGQMCLVYSDGTYWYVLNVTAPA